MTPQDGAQKVHSSYNSWDENKKEKGGGGSADWAAATSLHAASVFISFSGAVLSKPHLFLIAFVRIFVYVAAASDKQGNNGKLI